ncbi:hypothetical protein BS78_08G037700 [Paspalum vaginatum]|nr:hypothetical protein BS78_08G037700 [Paspalum vaginatum]
MEFAAMKRKDLRELCRQHGLSTHGCKAELAARLASALSGAPSAAAESLVAVAVGKGCLKQLGGRASGGTSGASKKVSFALDETSEARGKRRRSQMIFPLVVAKTKGRRKARKAPTAVSGRGRRWRRNYVGDSAHESVTREVDADAPMTRSRMKTTCSHDHNAVNSQNNPAEAEEGGEMVGAGTDRKRKRRENARVTTGKAQAGISHRITRSSSRSEAAVLLSPDVEKMRGGRRARNDKDELGGKEKGVELQDLTTAASPVESRRSSRRGEDCVPSVHKSSKVVVSCRTTGSSSVAATVMLPTVVGNKRRKTRGRPKAGEALPTAALGGGASQQKCDVVGDSVDPCAFGDMGTDALVTQPRTRAANLHAESGAASPNIPAEAEEEGGFIGAPTYRKRKQKIQKNAQAGVSHRSTRKSRSSTVAVAVSKPAKVEVYGRSTRSRCVAAAVPSPRAIRNKVRKAEDVNPNGELPTDLEVPPNDVPSTRTLRNITVQVNNSVVEETHVHNKPEIKRGAKDSKIAHRLTRKTAKISMEDSLSLAEKEPGSTKRVPMHSKDNVARNGGVVSLSGDSGNKVSAAKTKLGVLDERTTGMHEIVSSVEFQNAKGGDVGKQPAVRGPMALRRSARKCVLPA